MAGGHRGTQHYGARAGAGKGAPNDASRWRPNCRQARLSVEIVATAVALGDAARAHRASLRSEA